MCSSTWRSRGGRFRGGGGDAGAISAARSSADVRACSRRRTSASKRWIIAVASTTFMSAAEQLDDDGGDRAAEQGCADRSQGDHLRVGGLVSRLARLKFADAVLGVVQQISHAADAHGERRGELVELLSGGHLRLG